jgi:hypothetical protein
MEYGISDPPEKVSLRIKKGRSQAAGFPAI